MIRTIFAAILLIASFGASAQVYTAVSNEGESMDEFISRTAPQAIKYTLDNNVEVCGAIGEANGYYTLVVTTDKESMECKINKVMGKFTGFIFHTHTKKGKDGWANADLATPGYLATPRKLLWQNQNKMRTLANYNF